MTPTKMRELDAIIDAKVFGIDPCGDCDPCCSGRPDQCAINPSRRATTDLAAAMEVLKKCAHSDDVVIYETVQEKWGVRSDIVILAVDGETLELAICLFAKEIFK